MSTPARWLRASLDRSREGGYVAVMTALLLTVFIGLSAFAVDVGNWYLVGQQEQKAADAAAMAGVTSLPSDAAGAFTTAQNYAKINGFEHNVNSTTVISSLDGRPTRLRTTVNRTVKNFFGPLLGVPTTTISRFAVADYAGPVPMGSPCNRFGNNPDPGTTEATACSGVLGGFWANVNAPSALKHNGDPYQGNVCTNSPIGSVDGCTSGTGPNIDYATNGYYYTVSVKAPAPTSLKIELFDPVFVNQGLQCDQTNMARAWDAENPIVTDEATRYNYGASNVYCTGDDDLGGGQMKTQFTVRDPGTISWDLSTFKVHEEAGVLCQKTYLGYTGDNREMLDSGRSKYDVNLVTPFRRWVTLCTIANPAVGDYLVQVKTNGLGTDSSIATNHFAIRATGGSVADLEKFSISGREKMSIFANKPGVTTEFHLARVPSSAAGQTLKVRLFDVGDVTGGVSGDINIVRPAEPGAVGDAFSNCTGVRSTNAAVPLPTCSLTVNTSTHNGKWQSISVPIPANYSCTDSDTTRCWVRLRYVYGQNTNPNDVTAWTANIEGDPVRLVE
jgi:Putative Flp pilus-assembly TadE/G-like